MNDNFPRHLLTGEPMPVLYAVATWAQSRGWDRRRTWAYVASVRPDLKRYARSWPATWSKCRASVSSSSMAARPIAQARRLICHAVTPTDLRTKGTPQARRTLAVLGVQLLAQRDTDGQPFNAVMCSALSLGVRTGTPSATYALRHAQQQNWLTQMPRRAGQAPVWKLRRARGETVNQPVCSDAIDCLADPTNPDNPHSMLALLITHAHHPAWDNGALGPACWVEAIRSTGHGELPETMSRQAHSKARSELRRWDWNELDVLNFTEWLDRVARETGADVRRAELERMHAERHEARVQQLAAVKAVRSEVTPAPSGSDAELDAWMQQMLRVVLSHRGDAALQRDAVKTVIKRIEKKHSNASARWWMFMAGQWVRFAPMPDGTRPGEQVMKARQSIAGDVARVLMGEAPTTDNPQALAAIDAGAMWVREQIGWGTRKTESVRPIAVTDESRAA